MHHQGFSWHWSTSSVYWLNVFLLYEIFLRFTHFSVFFLLICMTFYILLIVSSSVISIASIFSHFVASLVTFSKCLLVLIWPNVSISWWMKPLHTNMHICEKVAFLYTQMHIYIHPNIINFMNLDHMTPKLNFLWNGGYQSFYTHWWQVIFWAENCLKKYCISALNE